MNSDVTFSLGGTDYKYMLTTNEQRQKKWAVQPVYEPPPSLHKNKLVMAIKAAPVMQDNDKAIIKDRDIDTVLDELRTLLDGDTITLTGYDDRTYYVTFDNNEGVTVKTITDRSGKVIEYEIEILCWDLYQAS